MTVRIQVRRDTSTNWAAADPILAEGEIGYISDLRQAKVGNGSDPFSSLEFLVSGSEAQLVALINQNTSSIQTEAQTRASADATLQSNINAEAAARAEADNELSGRIQSLENNPSLPDGLEEQVNTNTQAIQGLIQNDENLAEAINGKLGLPQGELTELNINDWLIIGRTDPNTGTTPTYLSRLSTLKEEIGGGTDPEPEPTTVLNWTFAGETFFQAPPEGGIGLNPSGTTIYVSKTNAAGQNIETEFLNEFQPGNLFVMQVPARTNGDNGDTNQFMQFSISQLPVSQGNWWNVATSRIINANDQNPWVAGETSLDIVVQPAPTTRTLMTDPETQPEDVITDPQVLEAWNAYKVEQGWEEDYVPTQQDVNQFFILMDQMQEQEIRDNTDRINALENPEPPESIPGFAKYTFAGEAWWGQPAKGELWTNFGENQIYISTTDGEDKDQTENLRSLNKGQTLLVTGSGGWARFSIKAKPSFGSGENGDYYVINVRSEDIDGGINIGDEVVISLAEDETLATYLESVPSMDPMAELYETVAKMKKEITSLKGQITRLKNGK